MHNLLNRRMLVAMSCAMVTTLAGPLSAAAQPNGVVPLTSLQLNGRAGYNGTVVLTFDISQAASAFVPTPYVFGPKDSFDVQFVYHASSIAAQTPADGLAFVIQNTASGPSYLGGDGSGLGFFGAPAPAIGVTLDYYQNAVTGTPPNTVAIAAPAGLDLAQVVPSVALVGGTAPRYVRVTYSNPTGQMKVYVSATPTFSATPTLQTTLPDLSRTFGGQVYFGVTAGTGLDYTYQTFDYLSVNVTNH